MPFGDSHQCNRRPRTIEILTRRKFLAGIGATTVVTALGADAMIEAAHPVLRRIEVSLQHLPEAFDGFTIAQLSDFHYDEHFSAQTIKSAIDVVNTLGSDIVVFTGDFATARREPQQAFQNVEECALLLNKAVAKHGVFGILGNHDRIIGSQQVIEIIRARGIDLLQNQSRAFERGSSRLWLFGTEDEPNHHDMERSLAGIPKDEATIALVHEPDFADMISKYPVDLQLSGHSHGGQIRLPFIGATYLPHMGKKYPMGLRQIGNLTLYTNVGIGTLGVPFRLNCPPEITLITLRKHRS